jgi:uncharacterized protein (TIGR01244 family)
MTKATIGLVGALIMAPGLGGAQQAAPAAADAGIDRAGLPVAVTDVAGVEQRLFRDGRVFIAGQPSEAALKRFKELGVTAVVCLRTPKEMDDRATVPFDEAAAVAGLGLEYVHIPLGGKDFPYTPAAVERFAQVLAKHPGPVLLHCTVAWRASYMWTAYLIRYGGLDLDAALARGRAIAIGREPLEELVGRPVKLVWGDAPAAAPAPPSR